MRGRGGAVGEGEADGDRTDQMTRTGRQEDRAKNRVTEIEEEGGRHDVDPKGCLLPENRNAVFNERYASLNYMVLREASEPLSDWSQRRGRVTVTKATSSLEGGQQCPKGGMVTAGHCTLLCPALLVETVHCQLYRPSECRKLAAQFSGSCARHRVTASCFLDFVFPALFSAVYTHFCGEPWRGKLLFATCDTHGVVQRLGRPERKQ